MRATRASYLQKKSVGRHDITFFFFLIYLWLCWVFVSVQGLSLVVASGVHSSSRCVDLSLSRPLLLRSTGSRRAGSVIVAHGPSCSAACGIFPDQGSNPCPLHWQADSHPLRHQGSPWHHILISRWKCSKGPCHIRKNHHEPFQKATLFCHHYCPCLGRTALTRECSFSTS